MSTQPLRLLPALLCALLFGCSSQPQIPAPAQPVQPVQSWEAHQQQLQPLTQWQIFGKIRIQTRDDDNSANLNWSQQQDHYRIYIAGPLGQGAVNIEGSEQAGIILQISGEPPQQGSSPEQLLFERLGWSVPIDQIPYWIRGLPAPQAPYSKQLDPYNRLRLLQQSGWTIDYMNYHTQGDPALPRKLQLTRGDSLKLMLILKQWRLGPLATAP